MSGLFASLVSRWRERRERRKGSALRWIKARYHIFRVLLADNERALLAMAEVDRLLRENESGKLSATVGELCETVLELSDSLNRLTDNGHLGLYPRLDGLRQSLDEALERYQGAPRGVWLTLGEVTPDMREQAGGKAQPLGTLMRAGLPVPDGFVITRRSCRAYLREARLEERLGAILRQAASQASGQRSGQTNGHTSGPPGDLEILAKQAQGMILASEPSPEFAKELRAAWDRLAGSRPQAISVRSSASGEDGREHSFAGQYSSVLGVRSPEALILAFKTVLASAFSTRAMDYRLKAGLGRQSMDMAVLCQRLVDARTSGVLFTVDPMDPGNESMLITAVPGLGELAVSGRAPADVYHPDRAFAPLDNGDTPDEIAQGTHSPVSAEIDRKADRPVPAEIALKTHRMVPAEDGGVRLEEITGQESVEPLLGPAEIEELRLVSLRIEALSGCAQDIEWSVDKDGRVWILQARPARLAKAQASECAPGGRVLLSGGVGASPGKAAGRLAVARSKEDLAQAATTSGPVVLALHQSLVDAAPLTSGLAGLLVDMGNPLDHLACLARENAVPMITGLGTASTTLTPGDWVLVDADRGTVLTADPLLWRDAPRPARREPDQSGGDAAAAVRRMVMALNLTDAYGPTFSILECQSLHDMVRFVHEKAVIALFEAGDAIAEEAFALVRRLKDDAGLSFLIIDLGGGIVPGASRDVGTGEILCEPLGALCRGMSTPGLRWGTPPPIPGVVGLMSRSLLDARSERPVGNPNYALVARDYLNLNARVDYHFAMIDAVCGANPRENSIRFRFKGGGTAQVQRERRARFVEEVMREQDFFTSRQGDMVTAALVEGTREVVRDKMEMLGRFLGFSRLLDATMIDDDMPGRVARAFLAGDYSLEELGAQMSTGKV
jgi:pyruvate,water dikinase